MSKVKMRCIACGKWFQSANAKEVTCPDCTQKARREKMAAKNAPPTVNKPTGSTIAGAGSSARPAPPPPKSKTVQGGTSQWLDTVEDVKVAQPEQPARPRILTPPPQRDNRGGPGGLRAPTTGPATAREGGNRGPAVQRPPAGPGAPGIQGQRPRQPLEKAPGRGPYQERPSGAPKERFQAQRKPKAKAKAPRPPAPPKPKREKTPPPQPFVPTAEQVAQVEARYLELANPTEFDGIRTQISKELGIPKKAVKKIIKALRDRQQIPSWWELQSYKGSAEELERIKEVYLPLLPVPPVGVHKQIAEQLSLKASEVYQAIKAIRLEMNLPQYNDPALHEELQPATQATAEQSPAGEPSGIETAAVSASDSSQASPSEPVEAPSEIASDAKEQPVESSIPATSVTEASHEGAEQ